MPDVRVVLVDDEPLIRDSLRRILEAEPGVSVVGEAGDGRAALELIDREQPDLVFLDVRMPELDGVAVARALQGAGGPAIIFVTAFDRYAVDAFEAQAVDYVLKPFDDVRVRTALSRSRERLAGGAVSAMAGRIEAALERLGAGGSQREWFPVRLGARVVLVNVADVDWIEAADNYVRLHTAGKRYSIRETMQRLEAELPGFVRIHRSAMVNLARVAELTALDSGDYDVLLRTGTRLRMSRRYREAFEKRVGRGL